MYRYASLLPTLVVLGSCSATRQAPRPAVINHVVYIKLVDPSEGDLFTLECDRDIASIPGVVSYWCGRHGDFGRDTVDDDYDIGLYVGFNSSEEYATYVEHPNHAGLVKKWRPRFEWIRIHDTVDETP